MRYMNLFAKYRFRTLGLKGKDILMGLIDKLNGVDYDELLEILAFAELQDITGWDKDEIVKKIKKLIHIKAITGRFHVGKQKLFFNSVNTTPYQTQKYTYGQGGLALLYSGLFFDLGRNGKNTKATTVVKCPNFNATKQVLKGNVVKCDYCKIPMEIKSF